MNKTLRLITQKLEQLWMRKFQCSLFLLKRSYIYWYIIFMTVPLIIFIIHNYFRSISLPRSLLHEINIMIFFNAGLMFTLEIVILCKKVWIEGTGTVNFWYIYLIDIFKYISLFAANDSFALGKHFFQKSWQGHLNFWEKPWKISVNDFIFRICNFTKNKLFLRYSSRILFKSFRELLS